MEPSKPAAEQIESGEELPVMDERDWPIYSVLMKHGDLYWFDPSWGNRYNCGEGWMMVLPWGEAKGRLGVTHGDNRFGVQSEDVSAFTLLTSPASDQEIAARAVKSQASEISELRAKYEDESTDNAINIRERKKAEAEVSKLREKVAALTGTPKYHEGHECCKTCREEVSALKDALGQAREGMRLISTWLYTKNAWKVAAKTIASLPAIEAKDEPCACPNPNLHKQLAEGRPIDPSKCATPTNTTKEKS